MFPGFRAQIRHELGDVTFVRCPDEGVLGPSVWAQCSTRSRTMKGESRIARFRHYVILRRRDNLRWKDDPAFQMVILHELGHAWLNPCASIGLHRSHFLAEAGATVMGYLRFGYLAPKVTRWAVFRHFVLGLPHYTEEIGLGFLQLLALWYAFMAGVSIASFLTFPDFPAWLVPFQVTFAAGFGMIAGAIADRRARRRGLKPFRLQGIW